MNLVVTTLPIRDRASWLEDRRLEVTASEIGALRGKHKQTTPLQLAYNKLYGEPDQKRDGGVLRRGHILEPACAAAVEHDHGIALAKIRHYLRGRDANCFARWTRPGCRTRGATSTACRCGSTSSASRSTVTSTKRNGRTARPRNTSTRRSCRRCSAATTGRSLPPSW